MRWPIVALGDCIHVLSGFAFKSELFNSDGRGLPLVRIRDVLRGASDTYYEGDYQDQFLVTDGDMLIGMDGQFNLAKWGGGSALLNQRVCKVTPNKGDLDPGYLFRFLPRALGEIEERTAFVTVKHLSAKDIRAIPIPLPPLDEQRRIAAILDQADALRFKSKHLTRQLRDLESACFVDCFGDLAAYPRAQFGDLVDSQRIGLVRGADEFGPDMTHPYVRMDAISRDGDILKPLIQTTEATASELATYSLQPGDFLFNTRNSRELVGKSAVWRGGRGYLFNNNLMRVRFGPLVLADFVQFALGTPTLKHELEIRKTGTTSVFAIYWRDLKTLPVPIPPMKLQRVYAERLDQVERLKASMLARHAILDSLFASLQHRAFSGELTNSDERLLETA